jgi:DNA-binding MurR/RpiR family transcriptional regulator
MHGTGNYTITDLAEVFKVSRPTVYRTLRREPTPEYSNTNTQTR